MSTRKIAIINWNITEDNRIRGIIQYSDNPIDGYTVITSPVVEVLENNKVKTESGVIYNLGTSKHFTFKQLEEKLNGNL